MTDMKQQQLNCRQLTWSRHLDNVAGLNMFVGAKP